MYTQQTEIAHALRIRIRPQEQESTRMTTTYYIAKTMIAAEMTDDRKERAAQTINDAMLLIEREGWTQLQSRKTNPATGETVGYCMVGSIEYATTETQARRDAELVLAAALYAEGKMHLDIYTKIANDGMFHALARAYEVIAAYNDIYDRQKPEVIRVMKSARDAITDELITSREHPAAAMRTLQKAHRII